jgi:hypothetical protein
MNTIFLVDFKPQSVILELAWFYNSLMWRYKNFDVSILSYFSFFKYSFSWESYFVLLEEFWMLIGEMITQIHMG